MRPGWCFRSWELVVSAAPDRWIRWTTTVCVALLALIAGTVSYLHMHLLVELHGQQCRSCSAGGIRRHGLGLRKDS
jgi:hypothetical protein